MDWMFVGAKNFNQPLNNWDVSNVKYIDDMFAGAKKFNQPLDNWKDKLSQKLAGVIK